ncbi:MAG TPA: GNAT family N-acetyltransferase [Chitinophagaceae bacterium]|jgi:GNAT superfamily N-acetyltransferase
MNFRGATTNDTEQLHSIRIAVKENILPDPLLITPTDYEAFLTVKGKGWICEIDNTIVGFAIIDLKEKNIWALFVHPDHERKGIGKQLQEIMLNWYFENNEDTLWLGTGPGTRAESFYRKSGWKEVGIRKNGEIKFEMSKSEWRKARNSDSF